MGLDPDRARALGIDHDPALSPAARAVADLQAVARRLQGEARDDAPAPSAPRRDVEGEEQRRLVRDYLEPAGLRFHASPGGAFMGKATAGKAKAMGVRRGFPDLLLLGVEWRGPGWCPPPAKGGEGCWCWRCSATCLEREGWTPEAKVGAPDGWLATVHAPGVALELKAPDVAPRARLTDRWAGATDEQREWLAAFERSGFAALVAYGCDDAVPKLRALGVLG